MIYHVCNGLGGGAMPFSEVALAVRFPEVLRQVAEREGLEYGTRCLAPFSELGAWHLFRRFSRPPYSSHLAPLSSLSPVVSSLE